MIKQVKISLQGTGSVRFNALQMTHDAVVRSFADGVQKSEYTGAYKPGDVNGDNTVSTSDSRAVLQHVTSGSDLSAAQLAAADYNRDGNVDTKDVRQMLIDIAKA